MTTATRTIRAPRGTAVSCIGWLPEAAARMLMNNLDPCVAERPDSLVVSRGSGKAAPVGVFQTDPGAPRVPLASIGPLFCEGMGPFRRVALAGDPEDIHVTDEAALDLFGQQPAIARWPRLARERMTFQGLPALMLGPWYGEPERLGVPMREERAC